MHAGQTEHWDGRRCCACWASRSSAGRGRATIAALRPMVQRIRRASTRVPFTTPVACCAEARLCWSCIDSGAPPAQSSRNRKHPPAHPASPPPSVPGCAANVRTLAAGSSLVFVTPAVARRRRLPATQRGASNMCAVEGRARSVLVVGSFPCGPSSGPRAVLERCSKPICASARPARSRAVAASSGGPEWRVRAPRGARRARPRRRCSP